MTEKKPSNCQSWLAELEEVKAENCSIDNPDCEACGS